jgi:hypothetical protein
MMDQKGEHNMYETSVTKAEPESDQVIVDAPANAGFSAGTVSSGNTNNNVDEKCITELERESFHITILVLEYWALLYLFTLG